MRHPEAQAAVINFEMYSTVSSLSVHTRLSLPRSAAAPQSFRVFAGFVVPRNDRNCNRVHGIVWMTRAGQALRQDGSVLLNQNGVEDTCTSQTPGSS